MTRSSVLLLAVLLTVASCTRASDRPSDTEPHPTVPATTSTTVVTTTVGSVASEEAVDTFRQCLIDGGLDIDPIPVDATGRARLDWVTAGLDFGDPEVAATLTGCAPLLEAGALELAGQDLLRQVVMGQLQAFSECMRDRGVEDFPDPVAGFAGVGDPYPAAEIPYSDPLFDDALELCRTTVLSDLPGLGDQP